MAENTTLNKIRSRYFVLRDPITGIPRLHYLDPYTNKPVILKEGGTVPELWDLRETYIQQQYQKMLRERKEKHEHNQTGI